MRTMKLALPATLLMTGFLVCTTSKLRQPEYAKTTGRRAAFCHAKMVPKEMAKNLNDAGTYYKTHEHKLDGYTPKK